MRKLFTFEIKEVSVVDEEINLVQRNEDLTFEELIDKVLYYYSIKIFEALDGRYMGGVHFMKVYFGNHEISYYFNRSEIEVLCEEIIEILSDKSKEALDRINLVEAKANEFLCKLESYGAFED